MPMRDQPAGVHRVRRDSPDRSYDIFVDGECAGWVEILPKYRCRAYPEGGVWRTFERPASYLQAVEWMADGHRAAKKTRELTDEPVTAAEGSSVQKLPPRLADPFRGEEWADPLAP